MAAWLCWTTLALLLLLGWRFVRLVRGPPASHQRGADVPLNVCVVLGSGGHTSEMMRAIRALPLDLWRANRPFYVVSATDTHSAALVTEYENNKLRRFCRLHTIPRAREVGQSYFLSIFTTLRALWYSVLLVVSEKPEVILVNGPGVCVPVVAAALLLAVVSPSWYYRRPGVAFMESYTCVNHLSLSARLLAPFCDVCAVHWRPLYEVCRRQRWTRDGCLFYVGITSNAADTAQRQRQQQQQQQQQQHTAACRGDLVALVTVGSTQYNALIEAVDSEEVCKMLQRRGVTRLLVQTGASSHKMQVRSAHGVTLEVFAYRPKLEEVIKEAALVISHAGAGTILEVLEHQKPLIVVPNRALMSDHQLELAEALDADRYLFCVQVQDLRTALQTLDFDVLRAFPGTNTAALREALVPLLGAWGLRQSDQGPR
ncbi:putative glycosyltransferase family 28 protein [Trypanosoma grayi]|uniref:putative glycosyltransferase family 28 protein n=1 Tax=Trypanosoma grayi TaxID=71804 RepID=UPI0004F4ACDE|nr:putative glycosyltransferase family 28 protein [Trypanosoma grayi]KEG11272.1 putative glycosyltransferase family 28 protein [Trypanosoma grayi]